MTVSAQEAPMPPFARVAPLALTALVAAAGCRSEPPEVRTVHPTREMPLLLAHEGSAHPGNASAAPLPGSPEWSQSASDPVEEARRRQWLEERYFRPHAQVAETSAPTDRYVPAIERPPERVIVVESEPSRLWLPPIQFSLGYWGGNGWHGGGGWGWGVGTSFPICGW